MRKRVFCLLVCVLPFPLAALAQLVDLPPAPRLSPEGLGLIVEFETGGRSGYNPRPEWPGYQSGVTVGIGYDCGYNSAGVILKDWHTLADAPRLARTSGVTGTAARPRAAELRDVLVKWDLAEAVFSEVTVARFYALTCRTFPGCDKLHPNAQAALVSLVFNRGSSLIGPTRSEMRDIKGACDRRDYAAIAESLRKMCRVWKGSDIENGMRRRRFAEAALVESMTAR